MLENRRDILKCAAVGLFKPALSSATACEGRSTYRGPRLREAITPEQLDAASRAGSSQPRPMRGGGFDGLFAKAAGAMKVQALTAAVAVADGGTWTRTFAAPPHKSTPSRFFWASVAKAYTASVVMQLVEEGKLSLDTSLDRWSPDFPNARWITVEDLLSHTSGLYSFQADLAVRAEPGYKTPERLLTVARSHPANFCAGAAWSYSNTGYVLLGKIVEALDGRPFHEALAARICQPLGLLETVALSPQQVLEDMAPIPRVAETDGATDDVATPYAAGALAASAMDVLQFWRATLANRLSSAATTRQRFYRLYPMSGVAPSFYGLGAMVTDLPTGGSQPADTWLGHAGGMPGAKAVVVYSLSKQAFVAVALTGDGSPEATAHLLLSALPDVS
jgi:D-alanyl-D-alanine carboxypeptidase